MGLDLWTAVSILLNFGTDTYLLPCNTYEEPVFLMELCTRFPRVL